MKVESFTTALLSSFIEELSQEKKYLRASSNCLISKNNNQLTSKKLFR